MTLSYLSRDSESRRNDFSLSVRDGDTVKHYRIRQLDEGGFFIARRTTFRTLQELVEHYTRDADGLCVNLRKACVQVRDENNFLIIIKQCCRCGIICMFGS
jgi:fyn-related kinase